VQVPHKYSSELWSDIYANLRLTLRKKYLMNFHMFDFMLIDLKIHNVVVPREKARLYLLQTAFNVQVKYFKTESHFFSHWVVLYKLFLLFYHLKQHLLIDFCHVLKLKEYLFFLVIYIQYGIYHNGHLRTVNSFESTKCYFSLKMNPFIVDITMSFYIMKIFDKSNSIQ
jgi:hypothetical protein